MGADGVVTTDVVGVEGLFCGVSGDLDEHAELK